ncbi:MAG TPA: hypothetical protein VGE72_25370 [Azospirillum sp.]
MGVYATDHIRALISKKRVAEMLARGWCIIGAGEEGTLVMEGPDPDLEGAPQAMAPLFGHLAERAEARRPVPAWELA